jgi:hypothetical protein
MTEPVPIPPRDQLRTAVKVDGVPHGYNVSIAVRMLDGKERLRDDRDVLVVAWMSLTRIVERLGVDVHDALRTMPHPGSDTPGP